MSGWFVVIGFGFFFVDWIIVVICLGDLVFVLESVVCEVVVEGYGDVDVVWIGFGEGDLVDVY